MVQLLFSNILRVTLITSAGICVLLLLKKTLFKEYTKSFNYYIWLIVIIRMIFPFRITIFQNSNLVINKLFTLDINVKSINKISNNVTSLTSSSAVNQAIESTKDFNINTFEILSYLWLGVALIIVTYRIFSYIRLKNTLIDLSNEVENEDIKKIYNRLLDEFKIRKNILLKVSDYIPVPFGIGVFNSHIILPPKTYDETEIKWILKHELMHYKKKDLLYKFLVMAVSSIYWFNPLIYVMNKYINIECELSCDEKILDKCDFTERKNYALVLINSLKQNEVNFINTKLATELGGTKKILKRRLDSMLIKKTKRGIISAALAITIAICSLGAISTKADSNVIGESQKTSDSTSAKDIIESYKIETNNYKGYCLIINDPTRVKVAHTSELTTAEETTSEIAKNNNAVAAINGISFGNISPEGVKLSGNGEISTEVVLSNGQVIYNGLKDDQKSDLFAITKLGQLIVGSYSLNDLTTLDIQEALTGFPSLVINCKKTEIDGDEGLGITPRTAIGQKKDGAIIMLAIDGNNNESLGVTIKEEQEIMYELGAVNAINLGGGSATTMYYDNEIINTPSKLSVSNNNSSEKDIEKKVATAIIVQ